MYLEQADKLYDDREFTLACEYYDKAISEAPSNSKALYGKAKSLFNLGKTTEAISFFTLAIKYDNDFYEAYYNREYSFLQVDQIDSALIDINRAIELRDT